MSEKCEWTEDEDGNWETSCGNSFILNDGTPLENNFVYCPYCGKVLREVSHE